MGSNYKFGPYILSKSERRLSREQQKVQIDSKSFDLLVFFVEHRNQLITKEMLKEKVWKKQYLAVKTIERAISRVRSALKIKGDETVYIESAPTQGYWFVCPVEVDSGSSHMEQSQQSNRIITPTGGGFNVLKGLLPEDAHAQTFFNFGQQAGARMVGSEQRAWLDFIQQEYADFAAALDYYGRTSAAHELELAVNLAPAWDFLGTWAEGAERLRHALARQDLGTTETKAKALTWFGSLSYQLDDYKTAEKALSEGAAMSQEIGDFANGAIAVQLLGELAEAEGRYAEATALLNQNVDTGQRERNGWIEGRAYSWLGIVALAEGNPAAAKDYFRKALTKMEEAEDKRRIAFLYNRLSVVAIAEQNVAQARSMLEKCQQTVYGPPGKQSIALARFNQGMIDEVSGQYQVALAAYRQSLAIRQEIGEKRGTAKAMEACGKLEAIIGNEKEASRQFGAAQALRKLSSAPLSPAERKRYRGVMLDMRKKFPREFDEGGRRVIEEVIPVV